MFVLKGNVAARKVAVKHTRNKKIAIRPHVVTHHQSITHHTTQQEALQQQ